MLDWQKYWWRRLMADRLFAIVKGRVQGVSFRWYTQQKAQALGLTGCARNLPNGSVEVLAEGSRPVLEALVAFLHEGSPAAKVDDVDVRWSEGVEDLEGFEIR
jgi:acylphosphatase